jgi:hypothetical protein
LSIPLRTSGAALAHDGARVGLIGSTHSKRFVKGATLVIKKNTIATLIALVIAALPLSSFAQTRAESAAIKPAKRKLNDITGT